MRVLLLLCLLFGASAWASTPVATVAAVLPPAWVEHRQTWIPAGPGFELAAGDRIRTGPGGRVLAKLAEGSELRLGAEASFELVQLQRSESEQDLFTGFLKLVRGALRFTTTPLSEPFRRRLDIQVSSINAGLSGTDVWFRAADDKDIVCLIEGRVSVGRRDVGSTDLDRPLSFYVAPLGAPPQPVAAVTEAQLQQWIALVALTPGSGVVTDGPFSVVLGAFRDPARAERSLARVRELGIPAQLDAARPGGSRWSRVTVPGFADRTEASAFARRALDLVGVADAWVR